MKGRTGSTLSRTKYVKCFRVETSCYRVVLRLKFIVTVELLYDHQAESDFVQCQTKMGALPSGSAVNLNKLNLIEIELFIKMLYGVWSSLQPDHETNKSPRRMQVSPPARNDDRSPIWNISEDLLYLFSSKDFPYIKGKIDQSIGINYTMSILNGPKSFFVTSRLIPWVPETFHARFPVSVKSRRGQWIF